MTMASNASDSVPFLICRCGSLLCALALEHVMESMRPLPVSPVPAMPSFLLGLAIIRGSATPVVHVALLMGEAEPVAPTRFVSMKMGARTAAFAVDSVVGIRALKRELVQEIPILLQKVESGGVAAITLLDTELLLVLESARIIPEGVWDALAEQESPA